MSKAWLIGVVVFVAVLVVAGLVVALVTTRDQELLPADAPEGAVQRFLRAVEDKDYEGAYGYLGATVRTRCSLEDLVRYASYREFRDSRVTLADTQRFDSRALVTAEVTTFDPSLPFGSSEYSYQTTFELQLEAGSWHISGPPYGCPSLY